MNEFLPRYLKTRRALVERTLKVLLRPRAEEPAIIRRAMRYSLFAGGKRLRPILVMAAAQCCESSSREVLKAAAALEMIHTYSLIHDDLPAMDDDDYRRGRLSNHKVYGEAVAILAGDSLLNLAPEFLLQELGREINTIGSKASDVEVTRLVVEAKTELERIREQMQNVE